MALFISKNNNLIISVGDRLLVLCSHTNDVLEVNIPKPDPNKFKNQQEFYSNEKMKIVTCDFSADGKYCAVTTINKQLIVFDEKFQIVHNLTIVRTASKVWFLLNSDLLVADKTGDVYLYELKPDKIEVNLILGHLSMVLDVITAKNDKYVITCDRDEKIRVSHFPNSYNIVSYCLGHEEFITNLEMYNSNILITASGDGTVRFWDFLHGKQLGIINTSDYIEDKSLIQKFSERMDNETVEVTTLPITSMKIIKKNDSVIIICSLFSYNKLLVFDVTEQINVNLLQTIKIDSNIIAFDISDMLYILSDKQLLCYTFCNNMFIRQTFAGADTFYGRVKDVFETSFSFQNISVLYKRKYNNVQEYHERKKLRIENKK